MIKIINLKTKPTPPYTLYIGRENKWLNLPRSKWHNPFSMKAEYERDACIFKFKRYILENKKLIDDIGELDGQILACYCHNDQPGHKTCHGDILRLIHNWAYHKNIDLEDLLR